MKTKIIFLIVGIFLISLISACSKDRYDYDYDSFLSYDKFSYQHNQDNRYYTYYERRSNEDRFPLDSFSGKVYTRESNNYNYIYNPYMKYYEKVECYSSPPKNRLFYVKCRN